MGGKDVGQCVLCGVMPKQVVLETAYTMQVDQIKSGNILTRPIDHVWSIEQISICFLALESEVLACKISLDGVSFWTIGANQEHFVTPGGQVSNGLANIVPDIAQLE